MVKTVLIIEFKFDENDTVAKVSASLSKKGLGNTTCRNTKNINYLKGILTMGWR